jgi:hypothetical protein
MYQISYCEIGQHISFVVRKNEAGGSRMLVFHVKFIDEACTPVSVPAFPKEVFGMMLPYCSTAFV